jgi:hypothetical protein
VKKSRNRANEPCSLFVSLDAAGTPAPLRAGRMNAMPSSRLYQAPSHLRLISVTDAIGLLVLLGSTLIANQDVYIY